MTDREEAAERRVTHLELFFDLVFVLAITQVTAFLADNATWDGLLRGLLLVSALWWAWGSYAWLTNTLDPEEGGVRLAMFGSMAAMLIVALATPHAFDVDGVVFGVAYFTVRALHVVLFAIAGRKDPDLAPAIVKLVSTGVIGPALLVGAGFLEGGLQIGIWITAVAIDYLVGILVGRAPGMRISPEHFVERHALIMIIALGESIVAIGIGAEGLALDAGTIAAALLGIAVVCALWWSYFDWVVYVAQATLAEATGRERVVLARDMYSYLHLPMVAGIVLFALGLKTTLGHVGEALEIIPAVGLSAGLALYFAGHVALRFRISRDLGHGRPIATVALLALVPIALQVPALAALALVAAVCAGLIVYEALRYPFARAWIRGHRGTFTLTEARQVARTPGSNPDHRPASSDPSSSRPGGG
jgi:low temperature requirement protein LtrA